MLKGIDSDTAAAYFGYRLVEPPTFPRCYLIVIAGIAAEDRNSMGHRSCLVTEMLNNWQNGPNESEYPEYPGAKEDGIRGPKRIEIWTSRSRPRNRSGLMN